MSAEALLAKEMALERLGAIRDTVFSSRNTAKGAVVKELYTVFSGIRSGLPIAGARRAIVEGRVLRKTSIATRKSIGDLLHHRYFAVSPEWVAGSLAVASERGSHSPELLSLAYLYFALRDRLTLDFVTEAMWERWKSGATHVDRGDLLRFIDERAHETPQIKRWRDSTRIRLASNVLSALRDFGLLKGARKKRIQRPLIAPETVYHLLCVLLAEGLRGQAILDARDWRLLLWSPADVTVALADLSQRRWIRFESAGRTVILELERHPEAPL
ncbi:MAG: DUF1819 family protein [Planctomycetes bacterium]|nr:DUF1819 family protein [Planctomycetota bacterium]